MSLKLMGSIFVTSLNFWTNLYLSFNIQNSSSISTYFIILLNFFIEYHMILKSLFMFTGSLYFEICHCLKCCLNTFICPNRIVFIIHIFWIMCPFTNLLVLPAYDHKMNNICLLNCLNSIYLNCHTNLTLFGHDCMINLSLLMVDIEIFKPFKPCAISIKKYICSLDAFFEYLCFYSHFRRRR